MMGTEGGYSISLWSLLVCSFEPMALSITLFKGGVEKKTGEIELVVTLFESIESLSNI